MKKLFLPVALLALLAAGCTNDDILENESPVSNELHSLSIEATVLSGVSLPDTRGIIIGTSLPNLSEIGVHVAKGSAGDGNNAGKPGTPYSDAYSNQMFSLNGSIWTANKTYNLSADKGTIYAYYPFDTTVRFQTSGDDASIPVTIAATGSITVKDGSSATNGVNNSGAILSPVDAEKDYMYYAPESDRIIVNNRSYTAQLTMKHALAQVSFRLIKSPTYPGAGKFTDYSLYDTPSKKSLVITGSSTSQMSIVNGAITHTVPTAGTISRLVTNYMLGSSTSTATIVSNLIFPATGITQGDISANFVIDGQDHIVTLPVTVGSTDKWEAGKNYLYSVTLGGTGIEVTSVKLTDWVTIDGGGIDIQ